MKAVGFERSARAEGTWCGARREESTRLGETLADRGPRSPRVLDPAHERSLPVPRTSCSRPASRWRGAAQPPAASRRPRKPDVRAAPAPAARRADGSRARARSAPARSPRAAARPGGRAARALRAGGSRGAWRGRDAGDGGGGARGWRCEGPGFPSRARCEEARKRRGRCVLPQSPTPCRRPPPRAKLRCTAWSRPAPPDARRSAARSRPRSPRDTLRSERHAAHRRKAAPRRWPQAPPALSFSSSVHSRS